MVLIWVQTICKGYQQMTSHYLQENSEEIEFLFSSSGDREWKLLVSLHNTRTQEEPPTETYGTMFT